MPTYEYRCNSCGEHLEVVQSFTDEPLTECPHCGGPLRKVFGSIGVVLKGSGFYRNDSRSGGSRSTARDGSESSKESSSKDGGSSGSDGAAKPKSTETSTPKETAAPTKSDAAAG